MATIRELFHKLGNDHNLLTVGAGVTKELVEECLEDEKGLSLASKGKLAKLLKHLDTLIKDAKEADKITREIHDRVYAVIDPDTGKPKKGESGNV